jgi:tRNA pseudouridine13 synthase
MKLKQVPEDFVVRELNIPNFRRKGQYSYFILRKKNWTTDRAIRKLASVLKKNSKAFSYSGMKDKSAITEQYVSVFGLRESDLNKLKVRDIFIKFQGYGNEPIGLNSHTGNKFEITVRDLDKPLSKIEHFCNYYDDQRFGDIRPNTAEVGKLLVQRKYEEAMKVYLTKPFKTETEVHKNFRNKIEANWGSFDSKLIPDYLTEKKAIEHLEKHPNEFLEAFKMLPKRILTIFVQAYQSKLFNEILNEYVKDNYGNYEVETVLGKLAMTDKKIELDIPLIGYDFINNGELKEIIQKVLDKENINLENFKFKNPSYLSSRTVYRKASVEIKNLKIEEAEKDELNKGKIKQKIYFSLGTGSYATMAIKAMDKK